MYGPEGAGIGEVPKDTAVDSGLLEAGGEDESRAQEAVGAAGHLIEARDKFSELGIPLISKRLPFQGPDIDSYLRYALQVDVASMVKELGELLELDPSEAETSQAASKSQPALPEDIESLMLKVSYSDL